jgi:TonB family protein
LKLLDVFLFYPEESELRDKNRKARKHENPAVGLMMKILADKWGTADYSLEIQGRYVWPVGKVTVDGVWDETRLVIVPVGKGGAMLFAFTGCQVLQTTFAGGFLFAGPNPNLVGPELVTRTFPEYPTALAGAGWTGMVTLLAEINTSGRILPETVVILSCPHALFASSSLKEITEKWLFRPALRNGQPIRFPATIEVSFRAQR